MIIIRDEINLSSDNSTVVKFKLVTIHFVLLTQWSPQVAYTLESYMHQIIFLFISNG